MCVSYVEPLAVCHHRDWRWPSNMSASCVASTFLLCPCHPSVSVTLLCPASLIPGNQRQHPFSSHQQSGVSVCWLLLMTLRCAHCYCSALTDGETNPNSILFLFDIPGAPTVLCTRRVLFILEGGFRVTCYINKTTVNILCNISCVMPFSSGLSVS